MEPSAFPTKVPSSLPTSQPSESVSPSIQPSGGPSVQPTAFPTKVPSSKPSESKSPSLAPVISASSAGGSLKFPEDDGGVATPTSQPSSQEIPAVASSPLDDNDIPTLQPSYRRQIPLWSL